jgi:hypothetical protein
MATLFFPLASARSFGIPIGLSKALFIWFVSICGTLCPFIKQGTTSHDSGKVSRNFPSPYHICLETVIALGFIIVSYYEVFRLVIRQLNYSYASSSLTPITEPE